MKYLFCRVYLVIILISPVLILPSAHSICPTYNCLDTFLLLAHKWKSDNLVLDLKINGQFEGRINDEPIQGFWDVVDDQNVLQLSNDPIDEFVFKIEYSISAIGYNSLELIDYEGEEFSLQPIN